MSPDFVDDERFGLLQAPFVPEHAHRRITRGANGAFAMQPARCGDRAGISGSFCECLATDRPHMRRVEPRHLRSEEWESGTAGARPLLFCRETARYYHRLFPATYSLRTPMVRHMTKLRTTSWPTAIPGWRPAPPSSPIQGSWT